MENQRDEQDETPTPEFGDVPILEYHAPEYRRAHLTHVEFRVPDYVRAATAGVVAVAMGWCTWLAIIQPVRNYRSAVDFFDDPTERLYSARAVSILFLAITCCACGSARAYWIRWRTAPEFWKWKARQEEELDAPPIAFREEE